MRYYQMTPEQIVEILNTRMEAAQQDGNPTEITVLSVLLKMAEEHKKPSTNSDKGENE